MKHQSESIAELISTYESLSDTLPCKEHIISNLLLAHKETSIEKIKMLLGFKTPYTTNQLEITNNSFSVFSFETACFESFGNGSFPISKEEEHNESYIKFSNDNIISKIKSKLNSSLQLSKQNPPLKISDSPINKSLNEISFDMEHSMIKNNSVKFLVERREAKPPLAKKNLSQFVNRNKVPKKASTSCEFRKSKVHLSDSSITSDTTSLSSKRNYRQNSTGNIFKRKMITEQNINDDAMIIDGYPTSITEDS